MKVFNKIRLKIKCFMRKYRLMNQFCKKCGKKNKLYDFSVSDEDWSKISIEYQNHVLCLDCFIEEYPEPELDITLYIIK